MAQGEIRLKISKQAYMNAINELGREMIDLANVHRRYDSLKNRLKNELVGETDDNYDNLMQNIEANMETIRKTFALAREQRDMLQRQVEALEANSAAVGNMIQSGIDLGRSAVNTISLAGDLVD